SLVCRPLLPRRLSCLLFRSPLPHPATPALSTLSLHDALPIFPPESPLPESPLFEVPPPEFLLSWSLCSQVDHSLSVVLSSVSDRSEEHTSELQSRFDLVCRLLLEKKKMLSDHDLLQQNIDNST